jgi:hypothetical protein
MRNRFLCLIGIGFVVRIALAYHVPQASPKPLKQVQDPAMVQAHAEAASHIAKAEATPVIAPTWITQIRELAARNSHREGAPAEVCKVLFKKDGTLADFVIVILTSATRTPNEAGQSHKICSAQLDPKAGKLKLMDEMQVDGPDDQELFSIDQFPIVAQELDALCQLQRGFAANELKYILAARVISAPDGKSWAWEVGPAGGQMPNVIYGMYYYPTNSELRTIPIERRGVAKKVEAAAKQAGLHLTIVKSMSDR